MRGKYIWDRKSDQVSEVVDLMVWAEYFEVADRIVAQDHVGKLHVSTVFLGIDHGLSYAGAPPLLFETMVFGEQSEWNHFQVRHETAQDARNAHARLLKYIEAGGKPDEWQ